MKRAGFLKTCDFPRVLFNGITKINTRCINKVGSDKPELFIHLQHAEIYATTRQFNKKKKKS